MELKQCPKCKQIFPKTEEYFYKQKNNSKKRGIYYTLSSWCRSCKSKSSLNWQNNNPETYSQIKKDWYLNNDEFRNKQRNKSRTPEMRRNQKEWRKNNPDRVSYHNFNRREKKKHDISPSEWDACRLYFDYSCVYCGMTYEKHYKLSGHDLHKEHVDDDGANDLSNCAPSCRWCNSSKWMFDLEYWFNEKNPSYTVQRYKKLMKWLTEDYKLFIKTK